MVSFKGIYDGKKVYPTEPIRENKKYKVIITFVEEIINDQDDSTIRDFGSPPQAALEFWDNAREDIYQDYLLPIK